MRKVKIGGMYKHFKGYTMKVITVALDSESKEKLVIYEHLDDGSIWARPLDMFLSPVDKEKYPDVEQKYRFELVESEENNDRY